MKYRGGGGVLLSDLLLLLLLFKELAVDRGDSHMENRGTADQACHHVHRVVVQERAANNIKGQSHEIVLRS